MWKDKSKERAHDLKESLDDMSRYEAELHSGEEPEFVEQTEAGKEIHRTDFLVSTEFVEANLDNPEIRIIEVDEDPGLYKAGHIPGAIGFDWKLDLQDPIRRNFLDPERFGELFGSRGVSNNHRIILYGDRHNWFAAYTYWYLRYYGHKNVQLMDGGRDKWMDEGRPVSEEIPSYIPERYYTTAEDWDIRASRDHVLKTVGQSLTNPTAIVDVRSPEEYSGERMTMSGYEDEGAQRPGHIPGAVSIPWAKTVREDGTFKAVDELEDLYREEGVIGGDQAVIVYCRIGERAAHSWFVLHELLGIEDVKNYDGSWTEYGSLIDAPISRKIR